MAQLMIEHASSLKPQSFSRFIPLASLSCSRYTHKHPSSPQVNRNWSSYAMRMRLIALEWNTYSLYSYGMSWGNGYLSARSAKWEVAMNAQNDYKISGCTDMIRKILHDGALTSEGHFPIAGDDNYEHSRSGLTEANHRVPWKHAYNSDLLLVKGIFVENSRKMCPSLISCKGKGRWEYENIIPFPDITSPNLLSKLRHSQWHR